MNFRLHTNNVLILEFYNKLILLLHNVNCIIMCIYYTNKWNILIYCEYSTQYDKNTMATKY